MAPVQAHEDGKGGPLVWWIKDAHGAEMTSTVRLDGPGCPGEVSGLKVVFWETYFAPK